MFGVPIAELSVHALRVQSMQFVGLGRSLGFIGWSAVGSVGVQHVLKAGFWIHLKANALRSSGTILEIAILRFGSFGWRLA